MASSKGCPKCGGAIYAERHPGNVVEYCCLQCGRRLTHQEVLAVAKARQTPTVAA